MNQDHLINAANYLATYTKDHLTPGWELKLIMTSEDAYIELINSEGYEDAEYSIESIAEACKRSKR